MVWFPELFQRFDIFEEKNPGVSASVCDVSSIVVSNRFVSFSGSFNQIEILP